MQIQHKYLEFGRQKPDSHCSVLPQYAVYFQSFTRSKYNCPKQLMNCIYMRECKPLLINPNCIMYIPVLSGLWHARLPIDDIQHNRQDSTSPTTGHHPHCAEDGNHVHCVQGPDCVQVEVDGLHVHLKNQQHKETRTFVNELWYAS